MDLLNLAGKCGCFITVYVFNLFLDRHIDIRLLPSIVPEPYQNDTARAIEPQLTVQIMRLKNMIAAGIIDQEAQSSGPFTPILYPKIRKLTS